MLFPEPRPSPRPLPRPGWADERSDNTPTPGAEAGAGSGAGRRVAFMLHSAPMWMMCHMKKILVLTLAVLLSTFAFAKTSSSKPKLTRAQAEKIALAKAPGTIQSAELENEKGKLVWSFDIKTSKTDITEILVNANDGSIVAVQHETPAKEAAEKAKEKKEKKH